MKLLAIAFASLTLVVCGGGGGGGEVEFSIEKTVLTVIGVIGTVALLHNAPKDDEYDKNSWWYYPWYEY